jgi:Ca-activated chloride channel family protein
MNRKKRGVSLGRILILLVIGSVFLCFACLATFAIMGTLSKDKEPTTTVAVADPHSATLVLAYSPEKASLLQALVAKFNDSKQRTSDRRTMRVELREMQPDEMVQAALGEEPGFQALSPDASLWLDLLDLQWADAHRGEAGELPPHRIADSARYAVSPIVIAAWPEVAQMLAAEDRSVGWADLQARATSDPNFRWSHASTSYASGMLATLAEFYAGAGKTRALTEADVTARATLDYVKAIEHTVSFYGDNEAVAMRLMSDQGRDFLDALVVQEALVVQHNQEGGQPLVAIYPREGTLWEDHPLALLDDPAVTDNQRRTFQALADFLRQPEQQNFILSQGFRPADLSIPIDGPDSPLTPANGVDPKQPQTTLQKPGPSVVQVVQNVWFYTKRPSNVYLVVDTSGSMHGEKLENVRTALQSFIAQIQGTEDRVGMVEFSGYVYNIIPLETMTPTHRQALQNEIENLDAHGDTALLDGVRAAFVRLQQEDDTERINAIVAMTDGLENASATTLNELTRKIERQNRTGTRIVIFTIAYGGDADLNTLRTLAEASGGQMRIGDPETIRELYRLLSQYF